MTHTHDGATVDIIDRARRGYADANQYTNALAYAVAQPSANGHCYSCADGYPNTDRDHEFPTTSMRATLRA